MIIIWYDVLKQRRRESGLTTKELGELIGVNNAAISNVERGCAKVSDDIVSRLQNYFLLGKCGRLGDCGLKVLIDEDDEDAEDDDETEVYANDLDDDEDGEDDVWCHNIKGLTI